MTTPPVDYAKMEAGPLLDVLVAERCFFGTGFPKFSTDIAAAWQVVEKMVTMGFDFELEIGGAFVSAVFENSGCPPVAGHAYLCASVPLAICRAALAALEHAP